MVNFNSSVDDFIISVKFDGISSNNYSVFFGEFNDLVYAKCFWYNSGKNIFGDNVKIIRTTNSGEPNNLRIAFNLDIPVEIDFGEILIQIHNRIILIIFYPKDSKNNF